VPAAACNAQHAARRIAARRARFRRACACAEAGALLRVLDDAELLRPFLHALLFAEAVLARA
jgi:hypothetical protein